MSFSIALLTARRQLHGSNLPQYSGVRGLIKQTAEINRMRKLQKKIERGEVYRDYDADAVDPDFNDLSIPYPTSIPSTSYASVASENDSLVSLVDSGAVTATTNTITVTDVPAFTSTITLPTEPTIAALDNAHIGTSTQVMGSAPPYHDSFSAFNIPPESAANIQLTDAGRSNRTNRFTNLQIE